MPMQAQLLALFALPVVLAGGMAGAQAVAPASPASLTPAQTASLDRAIRLWTSSAAPYTITTEGDHYRLEKKADLLGDLSTKQVLGGKLRAELRPLGDGRWQFDHVTAAMPLVISAPPMHGHGATQMTVDLQGQSGRALIDPSFATTSTSDGAATGLTGTLNSPPNVVGSFRSGALTHHVVWQPAGPDRINRSSAFAVAQLALQVTGVEAVSVTAADMHGETHLRDFSPERFAAVMAFMRLNAPQPGRATAAPGATSSKLTAADRQALHTVLDQVRQLASEFDIDATLDDLALSGAGHLVRFRQVGLAESAQAPNGYLALTYRMTLDGLSSPEIPAAMRGLVPHHLLISPRLAGISVDALFDAISAFIDDGVVDDRRPDALQSRGAAILAKGPVSVGLDALAFDVGPATLVGSGAVKIAGVRPQDVTATATLEAKGLDALLKQANTDPVLRPAAPVLIFLKGIGEESGGSTVWKIVYNDGRILVNGTDLSGILPHNK